MKTSQDLLAGSELGRHGSEVRATRQALIRTERSKAFMYVSAGSVALAVLAGGAVGSYMLYENWENDPVNVENWKKAEQTKQELAQQKLTQEEKTLADKAIAKAAEEAAAAAKKQEKLDRIAAQETAKRERPGRLLETVFQNTELADAYCAPSDVELTATFNAQDVLVSLEKSYKISGVTAEESNKLYGECYKNFSIDKFSEPNTLGNIPTTKHYNQLKAMWALCRNGFTEEDLSITEYNDGSMKLYYQVYPESYQFTADNYGHYLACMAKMLGSPQIKTNAAPPAVPQQP